MNDIGWKRSLWEFFAAALVFWIRPGVSRAEKVGVGAVSLLIVILVVFT